MEATSPADDNGLGLDAAQIRVLGVLIEKSFVTPDIYPMSINALVTGSNQLTAREPVMNLSESEVQQAIDGLVALRLVARRDQAGARVAKYEHLVRLRHSLPPAEQAVLATLMLRGPQTAGELRQRCERLHRFEDVGAVEAVLEHLGEKHPPLTRVLPRAPGTKEARHIHLLGGPEALDEALAAIDAPAGSSGRARIAELESALARMRAEFDALRAEFDEFRQQFD